MTDVPSLFSVPTYPIAGTTVYGTGVVRSRFYSGDGKIGKFDNAQTVGNNLEAFLAMIPNVVPTTIGQLEADPQDVARSGVVETLCRIPPVAVKAPNTLAPLRMSGEANVGAGYHAIMDTRSIYAIQQNNGAVSITSGTSDTTITTYYVRQFAPMLLCYGVKQNFELKLQYKRKFETTWTDLHTFTVLAADGVSQILRGTQLSLDSSKRPLIDVRIHPVSYSGTTSCDKVYFIDEVRAAYEQMLICADEQSGSYFDNMSSGQAPAEQINSSYQGAIRSSSSEFDRWFFNMCIQYGSGGQQSQSFFFPTSGRTNQNGATIATQGFSPLYLSGYTTGLQPYRNMTISENDFKITESVPICTLYGREHYNSQLFSYVSSPGSPGPPVVPPQDGMHREYINIYGGHYQKLIVYASMNGLNNNNGVVTIKIGHYTNDVTSADPIGEGAANWVTDATHSVSYTHDPSLDKSIPSDGTRSSWSVSGILGSAVMIPQQHNHHYVVVEVSDPTYSGYSKYLNAHIFLEIEPVESYPWTIVGDYAMSGSVLSYDPNALTIGKMRNIKTNDIGETRPKFRQLSFSGMGDQSFAYSDTMPASSAYGYAYWKAQPNLSNKLKLVGVEVTSDNLYISGITKTPFGLNQFYSLPSQTNATPAGQHPALSMVKPNETVFGTYIQGYYSGPGDIYQFKFVDVDPNVQTLALSSLTYYGCEDMAGATPSNRYGCNLFVDVVAVSAGSIKLDIDLNTSYPYPLDIHVTKDPTTYPLVLDDPEVTSQVNSFHRCDGGLVMMGNPMLLTPGPENEPLCLSTVTSGGYVEGKWYVRSYDSLTQLPSAATWQPSDFEKNKHTSIIRINKPAGGSFLGKVSGSHVDVYGVDHLHTITVDGLAAGQRIRAYFEINMQDIRHGYIDYISPDTWMQITATQA